MDTLSLKPPAANMDAGLMQQQDGVSTPAPPRPQQYPPATPRPSVSAATGNSTFLPQLKQAQVANNNNLAGGGGNGASFFSSQNLNNNNGAANNSENGGMFNNNNNDQQQQNGGDNNYNNQSAAFNNGTSLGNALSLPTVLHFIQSEWARFDMERNQWEALQAEMEARIALLQGERTSLEKLKNDLVRRIKMLECALRQERMKNVRLVKHNDMLMKQQQQNSGTSTAATSVDNIEQPVINESAALKMLNDNNTASTVQRLIKMPNPTASINNLIVQHQQQQLQQQQQQQQQAATAAATDGEAGGAGAPPPPLSFMPTNNTTGQQQQQKDWDFKEGRWVIQQYLKELNYTDNIINIRTARLKSLLGNGNNNDFIMQPAPSAYHQQQFQQQQQNGGGMQHTEEMVRAMHSLSMTNNITATGRMKNAQKSNGYDNSGADADDAETDAALREFEFLSDAAGSGGGGNDAADSAGRQPSHRQLDGGGGSVDRGGWAPMDVQRLDQMKNDFIQHRLAQHHHQQQQQNQLGNSSGQQQQSLSGGMPHQQKMLLDRQGQTGGASSSGERVPLPSFGNNNNNNNNRRETLVAPRALQQRQAAANDEEEVDSGGNNNNDGSARQQPGFSSFVGGQASSGSNTGFYNNTSSFGGSTPNDGTSEGMHNKNQSYYQTRKSEPITDLMLPNASSATTTAAAASNNTNRSSSSSSSSGGGGGGGVAPGGCGLIPSIDMEDDDVSADNVFGDNVGGGGGGVENDGFRIGAGFSSSNRRSGAGRGSAGGRLTRGSAISAASGTGVAPAKDKQRPKWRALYALADHADVIRNVTFHPQRDLSFVTCSDDCTVKLWTLWAAQPSPSILSAAVDDDAAASAVGDDDATNNLLLAVMPPRHADFGPYLTLKLHEYPVIACTYAAASAAANDNAAMNYNLLFTADISGSIRAWNMDRLMPNVANGVALVQKNGLSNDLSVNLQYAQAAQMVDIHTDAAWTLLYLPPPTTTTTAESADKNNKKNKNSGRLISVDCQSQLVIWSIQQNNSGIVTVDVIKQYNIRDSLRDDIVDSSDKNNNDEQDERPFALADSDELVGVVLVADDNNNDEKAKILACFRSAGCYLIQLDSGKVLRKLTSIFADVASSNAAVTDRNWDILSCTSYAQLAAVGHRNGKVSVIYLGATAANDNAGGEKSTASSSSPSSSIRAQWQAQLQDVVALSFDSTGEYLLTGASDGAIRLWNSSGDSSSSNSWHCIQDVKESRPKYNEAITSVCMHKGRPVFASGSADGVVRIYTPF